MALLKNYKPFQAPPSLRLKDLWKKFDKTWALSKNADKKYGRTSPDRTYEDAMKRRKEDPWNFLFIAGMWFQDLFNYDFRRTEMCIIPYATQQGEISFCAYNTGVGWRKIIENMHKNATVAQWYKDARQARDLTPRARTSTSTSYEHSLRIDDEDAARVRHLEHDIPLTAAEEDRVRRKKAFEEAAKVRAHLRRTRAEEAPRDRRADRLDSADSNGRSRRNREASTDRPSQRKWQRSRER